MAEPITIEGFDVTMLDAPPKPKDGDRPNIADFDIRFLEGDEAQKLEKPGFFQGVADRALGALEAGTQFATGAAAEVAAGIGGIAKTITSGPEAGEETIEQIREAFTFQPRTEAGKDVGRAVGSFLAPVGKGLQAVEEFSGDLAADIGSLTGSPTLEAFAGAAGATLPAATLEILGFKGASKLAKRHGADLKKKRTIEENAAISEAAPTSSQLKEVSRGVYREIDEIGATIRPEAYGTMLDQLNKDLKRSGFRPRIDDKVAIALNELESKRGTRMSVADADDLRQVAQGFAKSADAKTKSLGMQIINNIDNMLDGADVLDLPPGTNINVGERYRIARKFWGQAKKGEVLDELLEIARRGDRSGTLVALHGRIRTLVKQNITNKGTGRYFSKREAAMLSKMEKGDDIGNIIKNLAKMDATNPRGGGIATFMSTGGGLFGTIATGDISMLATGAAFPFIGKVTRTMAERLAMDNFALATKIVKAGKDARKITRFYLDNVPKKQRNPADLASLLKDPDISLSDLPKTDFTNKVIREAKNLRAREILIAEQAALAQASQEDGS